MGKLALVFPGIGYHADKPLLHYAKQIARKSGYEIIDVNYGGFPDNVKGDAEKMRQCFEMALNQTEEILKDVDFASFDEVLLIGKSVGTAVALSFANEKSLSARAILYTPVEQTFLYSPGEAIAFHGNSDPWANSKRIKDLCAENSVEVNIISDANHSLETGDTQTDVKNMTIVMKKTEEFINRSVNPNLKQAVNPYLPSYEYIPDGEPYVFDDRVYVYGSHDMFGGDVYCMLDYVCYSAPVDDLGNWRYEGVIYKIDQDPDNKDFSGKLYAPDVAKGPDGRYYLYYAINNQNHISVAVCDEPGGKYEFYGFVHYSDGTRLGDLESDEMQFDPGVLCEDGKVYLFTGFCPVGQVDRHGAMLTVLDKDMITIVKNPRFIAPSQPHSAGTGFEGHEFFEAPSIRKVKGKYCFIYSSVLFHELCYAVSDSPEGPFTYKGVIISNGDLGIDSYKEADRCTCYCANNHGSVTLIGDDYYIFYHRHTNGTNYCRQECFEKLTVDDDATIHQAMMTSCGSIKPLVSTGVYPTYIACNLFTDENVTYIPWIGWLPDIYPKITQDGRDGDMNLGYVTSMRDGATAGFKFFDFKNVEGFIIYTKGYGDGTIEIRTSMNGEVIGSCEVENTSIWTKRTIKASIPDGVGELYFTYRGGGWTAIRDFEFVNKK